MESHPTISVGIMDRQLRVGGRWEGNFLIENTPLAPGLFSATPDAGSIILRDGSLREIARSSNLRITAAERAAFELFDVTIGKQFHWQRSESQTFHGNLILRLRRDGTMAVINEIRAEDYLRSVISSEMNSAAPLEFLKVHAVLSRSWLLAALKRKEEPQNRQKGVESEGEIIRWYDREEHDLYDVCADDHCQRYQGIAKISSPHAAEAVRTTFGSVLLYAGEICDCRYSKACGGLTEEFPTAWDDENVPYLTSVADGPVPAPPLRTENEAERWIASAPESYCRTNDDALLSLLLPSFDRETKNFFRWRVEYSRRDLEEILREKSGMDFGELNEITPLCRGPSGRISRLRIAGSKKTMIVGKELEIRRWLSRSHLYSSAFFVETEGDPRGGIGRFIFRGAGWGHGVGLCQIGAAVMATKGFAAEEILKHYFRGAGLKKIY